VIVLRALGNAEIDTGVATLTPSQEIVFAAALYLILERGKRASRTGLASLLWPGVAEKLRAHRLRQTILQLKKLGFLLQADRGTIQLGKDDSRSDVDDASQSEATLVENNESFDFLPGYNPGFSEQFREWVDAKRSEVHSASTKILVHGLERARLQADWSSVEKIAAKCLALDGFNEVAVLAMAEAAAMRGGKRKAVAILDHYISEVGGGASELRLPATILRRRVVERIPDRPALLNTDPPFVGREIEMQTLSRKFEQARVGNGSATLLVGDPGIGKTRLSAELARFAELQGARVQRATCRRADLDRPLSLFVDIVPQLREMPGGLGCAPEALAWLKRLTEFAQRSDDTVRAVDSEMFFQNVRAALFDLLDSVAEEHCVVVLIEDVQWLDAASAKILVSMVEWCETRRIFFVLNARRSNSPFLEYAENVRLDTITLGPLTPVASVALLHSVALRPGDEPESGFVDWCLAVAEGNPFFLQELVQQWIETGHRYEVPPSVTKVIHERLSRLSGEALQVLQTCAVLSDHATLDRVERVLEFHPHQLLSAIEELSRAAMLSVESERPDVAAGQLQPRHDFLSSAAISRLAPVSLAFIHRRSADVLEKETAHQAMPTTLLWACAGHRHDAGDRERALSLRMSCAEHLLELGLAHDACTALQRSLDYCVSDSDRLKVLPRLAHALELDGEWNRSMEILRTCILLVAKGDPSGSQHNDYELALLEARHRSVLDFVALFDKTIPCVEDGRASAAHRVGAAILAMKLAVDFGRSHYLDAVYQQVSPLLHDSDVSERNRLELDVIYRTMRGDGFVPIDDLSRFADVARLSGGELAYSRALVTAGTACRLSARYEEGLQFVSKALEHAISNRLHSRRPEILLSTAALHIAARAFEKAREVLKGFEKHLIASDNFKERNEIHYHEARLALEEGDSAGAATAFDLIETLSPTYSVTRRGYYLALEVQIRLKQGAAIEVVEKLVAELEATHLQMRDLGSQDFESISLYLGLCALGAKDRGAQLLREHVELRRAKWPLPQTIMRVLEAEETRNPVQLGRTNATLAAAAGQRAF
jgi:DNA-binding SARP family transcriptional activator/tetratricopeptide (TPR) repeat protein